MNKHDITILQQKGYLTKLDVHFARFIARLNKKDDPDILFAAALVSSATGNGDVYLDLPSVAEKPIRFESNENLSITCPKLSDWLQKLNESSAVGRPGEFRPLILDSKNRLYLYRYWDYEKKLSDSILRRIEKDIENVDAILMKDSLERLFSQNVDNETIWHKVAAFIAAYKRLCVVSGGPGTGKTFTVAKILALLLEQDKEKKIKILLTAPTGKAAARISESIKTAKKTLNTQRDIIDAIPSEASTIHRMLKPIPGSPYFIHNAENPIEADVVVVDEASMIDLALMSKLVAAVPFDSKLIIIGDKDQLASVEAGAVLGDICAGADVNRFSRHFLKKFKALTDQQIHVSKKEHKSDSGLHDCMVILKKSYRFEYGSDIGRMSRAVNNGNDEKALTILKNSNKQIKWKKTPLRHDQVQTLEKEIVKGYSDYLKTEDPARALELFNRFRILCATKIGSFGVNAINNFAEHVLNREGLIEPDSSSNHWYKGRPVLITRNDYKMELFNGDTGVTLPVPGSGDKDLYVFFSGKSGKIRRLPPYRLPEHETVYAMTVHKSQGSEFDNILFILPEQDYPVLTRELFYTGITRAIRNVSIWGTESLIKSTISQKIERTSGLKSALWG